MGAAQTTRPSLDGVQEHFVWVTKCLWVGYDKPLIVLPLFSRKMLERPTFVGPGEAIHKSCIVTKHPHSIILFPRDVELWRRLQTGYFPEYSNCDLFWAWVERFLPLLYTQRDCTTRLLRSDSVIVSIATFLFVSL